jgi:hypothetical protein
MEQNLVSPEDILTSEPSFSIIVPTYQDYEVLARTLSNLIVQSVPQIVREVHVVSDGHDEMTEYVCAEASAFARKNGQAVNILYAPTLTHYGSGNMPRNAGLAGARRDWVMFIDSGTSVVYPTFHVLGLWIQNEPKTDVILWDVIQMLDPVPVYNQVTAMLGLDKTNGWPYAVPGIGVAIRRELAQSADWPDVGESDWGYLSRIWDNLRASGLSVEEAQKKYSGIPMALTVGYGAKRKRRIRTPVDPKHWDKELSSGWNEEKAWPTAQVAPKIEH